MFVMWVPRKTRRALLRNRVRKAYLAFRNVCEPDTLDQANPGNMNFYEVEREGYGERHDNQIDKNGIVSTGKVHS